MTENNSLVINTTSTEMQILPLQERLFQSSVLKKITEDNPNYLPVVSYIKENLPMVQESMQYFGKKNSSVMLATMTYNKWTPLRTIRQCLSQIEQVKSALGEHNIKNAESENKLRWYQNEFNKNELRVKRIQAKVEQKAPELLATMSDVEFEEYLNNQTTLEDLDIKNEKIKIKIAEIQQQTEQSEIYIAGSYRKMADAIEQINSVKAYYGIDTFTEEDFEKEEVDYHVITAFEQGLCSANARADGLVDEGNKIYFSNLGINAHHAQTLVNEYRQQEQIAYAQMRLLEKRTLEQKLSPEEELYLTDIDANPSKLINEGQGADYQMYVNFLHKMVDTFRDCPRKKTEMLGLQLYSQKSLVEKA